MTRPNGVVRSSLLLVAVVAVGGLAGCSIEPDSVDGLRERAKCPDSHVDYAPAAEYIVSTQRWVVIEEIVSGLDVVEDGHVVVDLRTRDRLSPTAPSLIESLRVHSTTLGSAEIATGIAGAVVIAGIGRPEESAARSDWVLFAAVVQDESLAFLGSCQTEGLTEPFEAQHGTDAVAVLRRAFGLTGDELRALVG